MAGDFFRDELPEADLFAIGRIIHDWSEDKILKLLASIHQRLPAGGGILISEKLLREDKAGPIIRPTTVPEYAGVYRRQGTDARRNTAACSKPPDSETFRAERPEVRSTQYWLSSRDYYSSSMQVHETSFRPCSLIVGRLAKNHQATAWGQRPRTNDCFRSAAVIAPGIYSARQPSPSKSVRSKK